MTGNGLRSWWPAEARATIALAYPLVLTNLAQALIPATDVILLGWAGPDTLAAASLGVNLYNACMIFGVGIVTAASPLIARAVGARAHSVRDVRRTVRQSMWAATALVCPLWALLWHAEAILRLFHQDPILARGAAHLVRPMMFGLLPLFLYQVLRAYVSALGRPGWSVLVGIIALMSNAILNFGLIFGRFGFPTLGLFGAGLGSAVSNTVMLSGLVLVVIVHPRFRRYRLFGRFWRADWSRFREIWRLGAPIGVTLTLEITIFNAAVFLMGLLGAAELAAHAVAIQIASLSFMVPLGISQSATVRVGLAYGRKDRVGVARAGWAALAITMAFMLLPATVMLVIPRLLVGLFLDVDAPKNAQVVRLAVSFVTIAALFQLVDGAQVVGAGMLRGIHDTTMPMLFAGLGYWGAGFGLALFCGFYLGWGGTGVWTGLAAGLAVAACLMTGRWARREQLGLV